VDEGVDVTYRRIRWTNGQGDVWEQWADGQWRRVIEVGEGALELEETPGSVADADLRAELAAEARQYAWLERQET
jgi:hypothetical protein